MTGRANQEAFTQALRSSPALQRTVRPCPRWDGGPTPHVIRVLIIDDHTLSAAG